MSRFKSVEAEEQVACNLIPMIDIMFLLLLFFMLSADMTQRDTEDLTLPVANMAYLIYSAPADIGYVQGRRAVHVDGRPVVLSQLCDLLGLECSETLEGRAEKQPVIILGSADRRVPRRRPQGQSPRRRVCTDRGGCSKSTRWHGTEAATRISLRRISVRCRVMPIAPST